MTDAVVVTEITDLPRMDTGAPCPLVLADEGRVVLSYLLPGSESGPLSAIVCFNGAATHSLGDPNEDTLNGHPLWKRGLRHYGAFNVEHSPLIDELERMNAVDRFYRAERFRALQHFVITMHDSTFECVAASFHFMTTDAEIVSDRLKLMEKMMGPTRGRICIVPDRETR
jgi:hypothetical protein